MSEKVFGEYIDKVDGRHDGVITRLYRSHCAGLITWLRQRYGEGPPEPEDIAQSAFSRLVSLNSLEHIENKRAFLFTIAANIAVSNIRSRKRAEDYISRELLLSDEKIEKITPERAYEAKQRFERLSVAFSRLSERQKKIVIRSRVYGQTYAQISAETGWSIGTIAADVKNAILALTNIDDSH